MRHHELLTRIYPDKSAVDRGVDGLYVGLNELFVIDAFVPRLRIMPVIIAVSVGHSLPPTRNRLDVLNVIVMQHYLRTSGLFVSR